MMVDAGSDVSQRVMRAAKQLFFAKGFAGTPLRAIATEAGTSESGVLRLYHSKNGLLRAVYASCWAEINEQRGNGCGRRRGERIPTPGTSS